MLFLLTGFVCHATLAELVRVPNDFPTVLTAIVNTSDGDTILIMPGTYRERIPTYNAVRTLTSNYMLSGDSADILQTIMEPDTSFPDSMRSILELQGSMSSIALQGLTFQHGEGMRFARRVHSFGGAVFVGGGSLSVEHSVFRENAASDGAAIFCDSNTVQLTVDACDFSDNDPVFYGTIGHFGGSLSISNSNFHRNYAAWCAGIFGYPIRRVEITNCVFDSNYNEGGPLAIVKTFYADSVIMRNCAFTNNSTDSINGSYGTLCVGVFGSPMLMEDCRFEDNLGCANPAFSPAEVVGIVRRCVFRHNRTATFGATVSLSQACSIRFEDCLFEENSARQRWGAFVSGSDAELIRCTFRGNHTDAADTAAALSGAIHGLLLARQCVFSNNEPGAFYCWNEAFPDAQTDLRDCWWGDASGPYHATLNPGGLGDAIFGDSVRFIPWLTEPPQGSGNPIEPFAPVPRVQVFVYPNPFNAQARVTLIVPHAGNYALDLYDILGRKTLPVWSGAVEQQRIVILNGEPLSSGIYFLRAHDDRQHTAATAKVVLVK